MAHRTNLIVLTREMYRQLPVRVHVRRPGRDAWFYIGRATVSHEVIGQTSRVGM